MTGYLRPTVPPKKIQSYIGLNNYNPNLQQIKPGNQENMNYINKNNIIESGIVMCAACQYLEKLYFGQ